MNWKTKSRRSWGRLGMKSEWKTEILEHVCQLITDGAHNSPKSVESGEYMASVKDFTDYGLDFSKCKLISENDYNLLKKQGCVPEINDILVGKDGARFFEDIIIYKQLERPALLSSIAILRPDQSIITPEFLYYTLRSPSVRQNVRENYGSGSAIPRIVLKDFKRMPISFPSIVEQRRITSILLVLDQKIQLNNEINKNLEQQAQTLYSAWFEQFIPFNSSMPSGWHYGTIADIAVIKTNSFNPQKNPGVMLEHYSIPSFDEQHYPVFECSDNVKSNKYILTKNSVLASKLNPDTKRIWRPIYLTDSAVCSTEFIVFEAKKPTYKDFLFSVIDSQSFSDWMCAHTTGSTNSRQRTTPTTTLEYKIPIASNEIIAEFCSLVTPMYDLINQNLQENQKLSSLRNLLLPRLISGEIDVSNIDF